jgi:hypothetical protein
MFIDNPVLGPCPQCAHDIRESWVLIEYKTTDGEAGVWAECPGCDAIVDPIHGKPVERSNAG